ncbi:MAG: ion transporter [Limnohabitans sp.]|nr:ion transporter [Limnohabitans sp.]
METKNPTSIRTQYINNLDVAELLGKEQKAEIPRDLPMRKWLYSWLLDPNIPGNKQKKVDKWLGILIVLNLFSLVFEQVPAIFEPNKHLFHYFDIFSVVVFTIEYAFRFYLAPEDEEFKNKRNARLGFVTSPFAIIDFLAVAPFYLQAFIPVDLRVLRALRLLRILKLVRIVVPAYQEFASLNKGRTFRQKMHALVFPGAYSGKLHELFDTFIAIWVLLSVVSVILESVESLHYILNLQFIVLDSIAVAIFTLEYCMRMYSCVEDPKYQGAVLGRFDQAKTPSTFIDLLAILPFYLEVFLHHVLDLRFLRIFRLARLLKLTRNSDATTVLFRVIAREWPIMSAASFIMGLLLILTATIGYLLENEAQPEKFENIPQSIYWAVITLASVGYGDISPVTPWGRAMTSVLALLGIGIFAIPAALLASAFSDELIKDRDALKANLFQILKDGKIEAKETQFIREEAKRLHLSVEEINALIDQVIKDKEIEDNLKALPLHVIAQRPAHAIEYFKTCISEIRQLDMLMEQGKFEDTAKELDRLTESELQIWRQIQGKA